MVIAKELIEDIDRQRDVITIAPKDTVSTAAKIMSDNTIGCLVIVDDGLVIGIISERDIVDRVTATKLDPAKTPVCDVMTTPVVTCKATTPLKEVRGLMSQHHIRHVAVLEGDEPVGMISIRDIIAQQLNYDRDMRNLTVFLLARLAETRDSDTGSHLERVREYTRILAEYLRHQENFEDIIDEPFVDLIFVTSPLHDIGKVSIPDSMLLKPGRLNDEEFEIMKTHAQIGADTLDFGLKEFPDADFLRMARDIACSHHERIDGMGYPHGLVGDEIPLSARVFAIADVYDALVSKRPYKDKFSPLVAKNIIIEGAGTQFDVDIVTAFIKCESRFVETCKHYSTSAAAVG